MQPSHTLVDTWIRISYRTTCKAYLNVQIQLQTFPVKSNHEHFALLQSVVHVPQSTCHCLIILTVEIWRRDYISCCVYVARNIQSKFNSRKTTHRQCYLYVEERGRKPSHFSYHIYYRSIRTYPKISSLSSYSRALFRPVELYSCGKQNLLLLCRSTFTQHKNTQTHIVDFVQALSLQEAVYVVCRVCKRCHHPFVPPFIYTIASAGAINTTKTHR